MDEDIAIPIKNLEGKKVSFDVLKHIPEDSASFYKFVPLGIMDGALEVGMLNPDDVTARDALQFITSASRMPYSIFGISQADFDMVLKSYQGLKSEVTKALGELDTEMQDGRFSARIEGRKIDFRVSTFPIYFGEKVVLRILDPDKGLVKLDNIGFGEKSLKIIRDSIDRPYGMILITGPTGSGKTTTLYSMLNELDREVSNVVSLED